MIVETAALALSFKIPLVMVVVPVNALAPARTQVPASTLVRFTRPPASLLEMMPLMVFWARLVPPRVKVLALAEVPPVAEKSAVRMRPGLVPV